MRNSYAKYDVMCAFCRKSSGDMWIQLLAMIDAGKPFIREFTSQWTTQAYQQILGFCLSTLSFRGPSRKLPGLVISPFEPLHFRQENKQRDTKQ